MLLPKPDEGGSFELCPAGTFVAVCYRFIDRGTHVSEFMGEKKTRREVMMSWELCDEIMSDGRPFSASKTYTWSMHEKATLRKDLESWRGKAFEESDFVGPNSFDTKKLLGAPCMLTITHETKGDRTYSKVVSIGKLVRGIKPAPLRNPICYLALTKDAWDVEAYNKLSDKMRTLIADSPEYREIMQYGQQHDDPGAAGKSRFAEELNDDIPF